MANAILLKSLTLNHIFEQLLVGLVSAYRYDGDWINGEMAKSEAKTLASAIKSAGAKKLVVNEEVIRILTTRSKKHLRETFKCYKEMYGKSIEEVCGCCAIAILNP